MGVVGQECRNRGGVGRGKYSANEAEWDKKDREVVGTIIGGFNHSDAICSTPFFCTDGGHFPWSDERSLCVCVCVYDKERVKDRAVWAQSTIHLS